MTRTYRWARRAVWGALAPRHKEHLGVSDNKAKVEFQPAKPDEKPAVNPGAKPGPSAKPAPGSKPAPKPEAKPAPKPAIKAEPNTKPTK